MSVFEIGITADDALLIEKKSGRCRVARNKVLGQSKFGFLVQWFYQDCTLLITRTRPDSPYIVIEVQPPIPKKDQKHLSRKQASLSLEKVTKALEAEVKRLQKKTE